MSLRCRCGIGHRWALPLAVLSVLLLSAPTWAFAREGTVIYFALVRSVLSKWWRHQG